MDAVSSFFQQYGLDFETFLASFGVIIVGILAISALGRFIFGKRSTFVTAVSSAIGLLFVYALNIVLRSLGADFQSFITPLPFISISGDTLTISGTGAMADYYYDDSNGGSTAPWNDYRDEISEVVFADTVTSIGDFAFYNCKSLTLTVDADSYAKSYAKQNGIDYTYANNLDWLYS